MTEMRSDLPDHHYHHFPCDCHDWHYLSISVDEIDKTWRWMDIADTYQPVAWKDRIKAIWTFLCGRPHTAGGILLDPDNVKDLLEVCKQVLEWDK